MKYEEITPDHQLRAYIKCFYTYESESAVAFEDTVFPSGCMEIIFNLGKGKWQTEMNGAFVTTPPVEWWGQIIQPLAVRSIGPHTMLGVRFLPHGAACFFREKLDRFNDAVFDLTDVAGGDGFGATRMRSEVRELHSRLLECHSWATRIKAVETFLLSHLALRERANSKSADVRLEKVAVVGNIMTELQSADFFDNISNVASRYGISSRYLQKLFLHYTGLTPKLYNKIDRFQRSLKLVTKKQRSLTSIAYDCGYFDQSHFIREFKSFTGYTPSGYAAESSPITLAVAQA